MLVFVIFCFVLYFVLFIQYLLNSFMRRYTATIACPIHHS